MHLGQLLRGVELVLHSDLVDGDRGDFGDAGGRETILTVLGSISIEKFRPDKQFYNQVCNIASDLPSFELFLSAGNFKPKLQWFFKPKS